MALLANRWRVGDLRASGFLTRPQAIDYNHQPVRVLRGHDGTHDAMLWIADEQRDPAAQLESHWQGLRNPWAPLLDRVVADGQTVCAHEYVGGVSLNKLQRTLARRNVAVPPSVAADLGRCFLQACIDLGDDFRSRALAFAIDPASVVLDWTGTWRFCRGGLQLDLVWRKPALREFVPTVAALLIRHALAGETHFENAPLVPPTVSTGAAPLWRVVEQYLSNPLDSAPSAARMHADLEALSLGGPPPATWRLRVIAEHFQSDRRLDELESKRIRGLATTILPDPIDQRLLVDESDEAYLVAADWLMTNEPSRGALAETQRALGRASALELERHKDRERDLFRLHPELSPDPVLEQSWQWREGWIDSITMRQPAASADEVERTLLHPAARYVRSLYVAAGVGGNACVVEALEAHKTRSLRRVHLSGGGPSLGDRVRAALPWVTDLVAPEIEDRESPWAHVWPPR